jgi:DNA-binding LytR/AlgR family response regulator
MAGFELTISLSIRIDRCQPPVVDNAMDALAELTRNPGRFDAVFTDVMMPEMSGAGSRPGNPPPPVRVPIVLTSGYTHMMSQSGASNCCNNRTHRGSSRASCTE